MLQFKWVSATLRVAEALWHSYERVGCTDEWMKLRSRGCVEEDAEPRFRPTLGPAFVQDRHRGSIASQRAAATAQH